MKKSENAYDTLPNNLKENIGFPTKYFDLSVDQAAFIDSMFLKVPIGDGTRALARIRDIQRAIEDIDYNLAAIEEEIESGD